MGEVYRAKDTRLDRIVAIKILSPALASDITFRQRFEREARTISAIEHPHICSLYDVGEQRGTAYIVMQFLEGQTLAQRLEKGPLPIDQAVRYATEMADALDAAHRRGIIHRDLKPGNIMLTRTGARLLDFGLAKLREPITSTLSDMTALATQHPATAEGMLLGTMPYMAPEQVEGREADARSDVFALGAVLYELVTGQRAFPGATAASVIGAILKDDPPPIASRQPLAPPALEHVIRTCLAKDPDERWQSAADVKRELAWIASTLSAPGASTLSAPGLTPAVRPGKRRPPFGWFAAAALVIALVATLPAALRQWSSTPVETPVLRFEIAPPANVIFAATGASIPSTQLALSPDGRLLAFVAGLPGERPALWIRALDTLEARMLVGTDDASYPFWSPDSRFLGFFAAGKLKKVDITGGPAQALCDVASDARGGTWSADGILFAPSTASGLFQVSAAGGVPVRLFGLRDGESSYRWPMFLPGGRHFVVYVRAAVRQGIYLGSVDDKTLTWLFDTRFNAIYSPPGFLLTVRDGALFAYPFDLKTLSVTGEPVRVAGQIGGSSTNMASLSAENGVLAYASGLTTLTRLEWFDRQGKALGAATDTGGHINFRLSPDETRVALTRVDPQTNTSDVWVLDLARRLPTRFTFDAATDTTPIWSPDGARIIFRSDRAGGNFIFEKPVAGGASERLLGRTDVPFPTDWSPDGKTILYHAPGNNSYDVRLIALADGAKPQSFTDSAFNEIYGRFSPDGRWIAYSSDESGQMQVYVQTYPKSGGKWQVSTAGGSEPHWRGDGKELFFLAPDRTLMAVDVRASSSTFDVGVPKTLFQTRTPGVSDIFRMNYDVTDAGNRFLVNSLVEGARSSPIVVVTNWTAALKKP